MTNSSHSPMPCQVFISFRGTDKRNNLVSFLKSKLEEISDINVFIDESEIRGVPITKLFERIRESTIALIIFSKKYPESTWCLDELVEIKKQMDTESIIPFPIFYKVKAHDVKRQTGNFGNDLLRTEDDVRNEKGVRKSSNSILETEARIWGWRQALVAIGGIMGLSYQHSSDYNFVNELVEKVKEMLGRKSSSRNGLITTGRTLMHPQETATSSLQAPKLKKPDLGNHIIEPPIQINSVVSQSTNHLVFLDLMSLNNPTLAQRLIEPDQSGRILLVLLGSLDYNEGFAFNPRNLPKKPRQLLDCTDVDANSFQTPESNDNLRNLEDNNSDAALTCFSFLRNILKRCATIFRGTPMLSDPGLALTISSPPSRSVFISFGEKQLEKTLVSFLKKELELNRISVHVEYQTKGRIEESRVAIVIFSIKFSTSNKCLDELVEIKKLMDAGEIDPFPVFYDLEAESVTELTGWFRLRILKIEDEERKNITSRDDESILYTESKIQEWRQALSSIASRPGLSYQHSCDAVFVSDVVTKVKELFALKESQKNPISNETTDLVVEKKPLMHQQETKVATTAYKSLDDGLLYSPTSFLQALNLETTDIEGFTDIPNGLVSLRLKGHTNLVFLNLSSLKNLVQFQRSDSFKFLTEGFAMNPSGAIRLGEPSLAMALESN